MSAYLVRITETHDLVGFFVADNEDALAYVVDECTDPSACEYTELGAGGIMWESPARPVPLSASCPEDDESPIEPLPWGGASLTEYWSRIAYGIVEADWVLFGDGTDTTEPPDRPKPSVRGRVVPFRKPRK